MTPKEAAKEVLRILDHGIFVSTGDDNTVASLFNAARIIAEHQLGEKPPQASPREIMLEMLPILSLVWITRKDETGIATIEGRHVELQNDGSCVKNYTVRLLADGSTRTAYGSELKLLRDAIRDDPVIKERIIRDIGSTFFGDRRWQILSELLTALHG